jgi:hypothetical protein
LRRVNMALFLASTASSALAASEVWPATVIRHFHGEADVRACNIPQLGQPLA